MNIKKQIATALSAVILLAPVMAIANTVDTDTSQGIVDFRGGDLEIPGERCPYPDNHLKPPCPGGATPVILVPHFDFGSHEISIGAYQLPALPSTQEVFGGLPAGYTFEDDINVPGAVVTDRAHFIEVSDFRGTGAGWHLNVSRTEFFSQIAWSQANPTGGFANVPAQVTGNGENFLRGALLTFNNISAFPVGTGTAPTVFPNFATAGTHLFVPGPGAGGTTPTATFVSTGAVLNNEGRGIHRIQIGGRTSQADANAALADRADHAPTLARNANVQLSLPPQVQIQAGQRYTAVLTWDLMAGPGTVSATQVLPPWAQ